MIRSMLRKTMLSILATIFILSTFSSAQDSKVVKSEFKVFGNCGMCKSHIEKAMKIPEVKFAKWDKKSKMLTVAYLADKISVDSLQQRVAFVGHDTEKFKASNKVYNNLPGCCLYREEHHPH